MYKTSKERNKKGKELRKTSRGITLIALVITIVIIILSVIIAGVIYYINQQQFKVEKLSLCSITTYDSQEITDYENNNRAFKINSINKNLEIKVNGKDYEDKGIYKPGTYTIEVKNSNKKEIATINIKELEEQNRNEYDK